MTFMNTDHSAIWHFNATFKAHFGIESNYCCWTRSSGHVTSDRPMLYEEDETLSQIRRSNPIKPRVQCNPRYTHSHTRTALSSQAGQKVCPNQLYTCTALVVSLAAETDMLCPYLSSRQNTNYSGYWSIKYSVGNLLRSPYATNT